MAALRFTAAQEVNECIKEAHGKSLKNGTVHMNDSWNSVGRRKRNFGNTIFGPCFASNQITDKRKIMAPININLNEKHSFSTVTDLLIS